MPIPQQYLPVMPYLILPEAQNFLIFAKDVFGAVEQLIVTDEEGNIRHGEIKIGQAVVMFSSGSGQYKEKPAALYLYVEDVQKVYSQAIIHGSSSLETPHKKEYGFSAGFEDPFHNFWFIVEEEQEESN